jgi:hypothetical protein
VTPFLLPASFDCPPLFAFHVAAWAPETGLANACNSYYQRRPPRPCCVVRITLGPPWVQVHASLPVGFRRTAHLASRFLLRPGCCWLWAFSRRVVLGTLSHPQSPVFLCTGWGAQPMSLLAKDMETQATVASCEVAVSSAMLRLSICVRVWFGTLQLSDFSVRL